MGEGADGESELGGKNKEEGEGRKRKREREGGEGERKEEGREGGCTAVPPFSPQPVLRLPAGLIYMSTSYVDDRSSSTSRSVDKKLPLLSSYIRVSNETTH